MTLEELAEQIQAVQKALSLSVQGILPMSFEEHTRLELDLENMKNQERALLRALENAENLAIES